MFYNLGVRSDSKGIPGRNFWKKIIGKQKSMKNYPEGKELIGKFYVHTLISLFYRAGWFEPYLVCNSEDSFFSPQGI